MRESVRSWLRNFSNWTAPNNRRGGMNPSSPLSVVHLIDMQSATRSKCASHSSGAGNGCGVVGRRNHAVIPPPTAPLLMLLLLPVPYSIFGLLSTFTVRHFDPREAAAMGLTWLFTMTAIGPFTDTHTMAQMLPAGIPARVSIVHGTGVMGFLIAARFLVQKWRRHADPRRPRFSAGSAIVLLSR